VLLGEAVLRLLATVGAGSGLLLVLADLHWADPETLAVVEYLADNLPAEPVALVTTVRTGTSDPALRLASAREARPSASVHELGRLGEREVERMARACLRETAMPKPVAAQLRASSDGVPLLVEELLAAWVGSGALVQEPGGWVARRYVAPGVPLTFADSVRRRFEALDGRASGVLQAAALLGRRFDWTLLAAASGVEEGAVATALRRAVEAQLLAADQRGFPFRHTLTRDVVLTGTLPPERISLARGALSALVAGSEERDELAAR